MGTTRGVLVLVIILSVVVVLVLVNEVVPPIIIGLPIPQEEEDGVTVELRTGYELSLDGDRCTSRGGWCSRLSALVVVVVVVVNDDDGC